MDDDGGGIIWEIFCFLIIIGLVKKLIEIVIAIVLVLAIIAGALAVIYFIYKGIQSYMKKNLEDYIAEREEELRIHSGGKERLSLGDYTDMDKTGRQYKKLRRAAGFENRGNGNSRKC